MRITSSKPKGQRIFKSMMFKHTTHEGKLIKIKRPLSTQPEGHGWWFYIDLGQWSQEFISGSKVNQYYSMTCDGYNNVYSLKAAKRLIAKWDTPKGTKFRVSLPFVGYHFFITKP
jgi:hypothetical protein